MPSVNELRAHRAELMQRVEQVDDWIKRQQRIDDEYTATFLGIADKLPSIEAAAPADPSGSSGKRGPNGSRPEEIVEAAKRAVYVAGKPLTRYQLVDAVEATGLTVGGRDKPRNMGTILWRSGEFDNDGDGYWPKGVNKNDLAL